MTDLDEAKELLMTLTKQGVSTEPTSLHRAVMLLLWTISSALLGHSRMQRS